MKIAILSITVDPQGRRKLIKDFCRKISGPNVEVHVVGKKGTAPASKRPTIEAIVKAWGVPFYRVLVVGDRFFKDVNGRKDKRELSDAKDLGMPYVQITKPEDLVLVMIAAATLRVKGVIFDWTGTLCHSKRTPAIARVTVQSLLGA